jgi:hypothetical protein
VALKFVTRHPDAVALDLGVGLDTRAFRIAPPSTVDWYDIDFGEVITGRQRLLPDLANAHGVGGVGTDLTDPTWLDAIPTDRPAVIVADGLLAFLTQEDMIFLLIRVDPAANRVVARIGLPVRPDALGVSPGGVWVRAARGPVWHVDPASNRVVATIRVPGGLGATRGSIVVTSEAVWVSDPANGTLLQLDPARNRAVVGWEAAGRALAVVGEVVWTAGDGGLVGFGRGRVRPVQAEEIHARAVTGLTVGSGALWAATPSGLLRLDLRRLP